MRIALSFRCFPAIGPHQQLQVGERNQGGGAGGVRVVRGKASIRKAKSPREALVFVQRLANGRSTRHNGILPEIPACGLPSHFQWPVGAL